MVCGHRDEDILFRSHEEVVVVFPLSVTACTHVNIHRMSFANKQPQYREMCQYRKEVEKDILITCFLLVDKNGILFSIQSIFYVVHKLYTCSSKQYRLLQCACECMI